MRKTKNMHMFGIFVGTVVYVHTICVGLHKYKFHLCPTILT